MNRWRFYRPAPASYNARCFERIAAATHPAARMGELALRALCWRDEIALLDHGHQVFDVGAWQVRPLGAGVWVAAHLYDSSPCIHLHTVADLLALLNAPPHARTQPANAAPLANPARYHKDLH